MFFVDRDLVKNLKERYPKGTKICVDSMNDDPNPVEQGSIGEVLMVYVAHFFFEKNFAKFTFYY